MPQQGQEDGRREAEDQVLQIDQQRIAEKSSEIIAVEELVEVFVPGIGPLAAEDAAGRTEILEGDDHAAPGHITENDIIDQAQ